MNREGQDVVEFLTARLDKDEALASGSLGEHWSAAGYQEVRTSMADSPRYTQVVSTPTVMEHWDRRWTGSWGSTFRHIAAHDPAFVLADIAAKRQIIAEYAKSDETAEYPHIGRDYVAGLNYAVYMLTLAYADHPDYREEWTP